MSADWDDDFGDDYWDDEEETECWRPKEADKDG